MESVLVKQENNKLSLQIARKKINNIDHNSWSLISF